MVSFFSLEVFLPTLKANPVVEISWNERQLAETHMKNCEMVIERVDLSQLNDKSNTIENSEAVYFGSRGGQIPH